MIQIFSTANVAATGQKFMVYGGPGSGKTPLISTLQPWNPITLSAENGLLSLSQHNLPYISIKTEQDLDEAYRWYLTSTEAQQFGALCLDSISEVADTMVEESKGKTKDGRQAYWAVMEDILKWTKKFQAIQGRHVYVISKEFYDKDEASGLMKWFPHVGAKSLGPQLAYIMDCVFRLKRETNPATGQSSAVLQCRSTSNADCRVRDPKNTIQLHEPADLGAIINKLQ